MRHLFALLTLLGTMQVAPAALALQQERGVFANNLRQESTVMTLKVHNGYGLNINLIPTGDVIRRVWLDDPSRVTLDFDADLETTGAQIVHIKRVKPLDFLNLPQTPATLLTLVTEAPSGRRNLYQFRLTYGDGVPEYSTLTIYPESQGTPFIDVGMLGIQATVADVERGRKLAEQKGLLERSNPLWNRVQDFVASVRNGESVLDAAERAGVSMALVKKLAKEGLTERLAERYRPEPELETISGGKDVEP